MEKNQSLIKIITINEDMSDTESGNNTETEYEESSNDQASETTEDSNEITTTEDEHERIHLSELNE